MTFERRDRVAPCQMRCDPIFKGIHEVLSAFFKSFARCPQSFEFWNFAIKWLWVIDDLVFSSHALDRCQKAGPSGAGCVVVFHADARAGSRRGARAYVGGRLW
ncbi:MAG: hypothetical protein PHQ34_00200 [Methanothrix sp.]|nr:hypothetical protein [Methanothrix sp.]